LILAFASPAGAWQGGPDHDHVKPATCTGTLDAPGVLSGTYFSNVVVNGACAVNAGPAVIKGDLFITPGSTVASVFALDAQSPTSTGSSLTVAGDVFVQHDGALILGCEPEAFPCVDDPSGTLSSHGRIGGDLIATGALGVVMHATTVYGDVRQGGGGGGLSCDPPFPGVFGLFGGPAYSDYEDNSIGGSLGVVGLQTCWFGALRDKVHGDAYVVKNSLGDPDAMEVVSNDVSGDVACFGNSPHVQFGDSGGTPNQVGGFAFGECGFHALAPNPAPDGPLAPISIRKPDHNHYGHYGH
jgi:hypothetical protein